MITPERRARDTPGARFAGIGIIDCDVHPNMGPDLAHVVDFMPTAWRTRFEAKGVVPLIKGPGAVRFAPIGGGERLDARAEKGQAACSDVAGSAHAGTRPLAKTLKMARATARRDRRIGNLHSGLPDSDARNIHPGCA